MNYRSVAAMLRKEISDHAAYERMSLKILESAKSNLEAYEALSHLESLAANQSARYRMIGADIAYRVLEDGKKRDVPVRTKKGKSRNDL